MTNKHTSADRLLRTWAGRYQPDASLFLWADRVSINELTKASSLEERTQTAQKLKGNLYVYSKLAWLRTSDLLSADANVSHLSEIRLLARLLSQVFEQILDIYTWPQPPIPLITSFTSDRSTGNFAAQAGGMLTQKLPAVDQLVAELKPVLDQLQQQHLLANNSEILGFMTTPLHFGTEEILQRVTPAEKVLLSPYFKFAEEQICIPWQQVCAATDRHAADSSILSFVEQLLAASQAIAQSVYQQLLTRSAAPKSLRGRLTLPKVRDSTIRDIVMFQAYLALGILEGSMASLKQKLLPLCQTVFPRLGMHTSFISRTLQLLVDEIQVQCPSEEFTPYSVHVRQFLTIFPEE